MKENKVKNIYIYPAKSHGEIATEVGFFLEPRLDRLRNVLTKLNVINSYGEVCSIKYGGKTLMISIKNDPKSICIRKAERGDIEKYKEAFDIFVQDLSKEDCDIIKNKLYLYLEEYYEEQPDKNKEKTKIE